MRRRFTPGGGWRLGAARGTTAGGPASPPMASREMVRGAAMAPVVRRCASRSTAPAWPARPQPRLPPKTTDHSRLRLRDNQILGRRKRPKLGSKGAKTAVERSILGLEVSQDREGVFGLAARGIRGVCRLPIEDRVGLAWKWID